VTGEVTVTVSIADTATVSITGIADKITVATVAVADTVSIVATVTVTVSVTAAVAKRVLHRRGAAWVAQAGAGAFRPPTARAILSNTALMYL